jgi:hypothetical protein
MTGCLFHFPSFITLFPFGGNGTARCDKQRTVTGVQGLSPDMPFYAKRKKKSVFFLFRSTFFLCSLFFSNATVPNPGRTS